MPGLKRKDRQLEIPAKGSNMVGKADHPKGPGLTKWKTIQHTHKEREKGTQQQPQQGPGGTAGKLPQALLIRPTRVLRLAKRKAVASQGSLLEVGRVSRMATFQPTLGTQGEENGLL